MCLPFLLNTLNTLIAKPQNFHSFVTLFSFFVCCASACALVFPTVWCLVVQLDCQHMLKQKIGVKVSTANACVGFCVDARWWQSACMFSRRMSLCDRLELNFAGNLETLLKICSPWDYFIWCDAYGYASDIVISNVSTGWNWRCWQTTKGLRTPIID